MKKMQLADKQMDRFTWDELEKLLTERHGPCISLFLPVERRGIETKGNPVRLRHLLDQAEACLTRLGIKNGQGQELLAPIRGLVEDTWFWQHQSSGLALFAAPGEFFSWRLPLKFIESAHAGARFMIRPLTPLLTGDGVFYVLALAKGGVRLLECSRHAYGEVELAGVPTSLPEELRYDVFEISAQQHTVAMEGTGQVGMWHGHGGASDAAELKDHVREFCRHLDDGVCAAVGGSRAPLVLAGVEFMRGFYRELSHYSNIVEEGINASPDLMREEELHRRGWEIVLPLFRRQREAALALYYQRTGSGEGRTGNTLETVVPAAFYKRIETLFIPCGAHAWGRFNSADDTIAIHGQWEPGDEDLIDMAAAHTLRNRGNVYELPVEAMPEGAPVAALLRF